MMKTGKMNTLVDFLINRNEFFNNTTVYTFIADKGNSVEPVTYGNLHERAAVIGGYLQERYKKGDRILLSLKPGMEFIESFMGCIYGGMIPVPMYPPFSRSFIGKIEHVIKDASPLAMIISEDLLAAGRMLGWECRQVDVVMNDLFLPH
jgi:acyl-CoA synthetase (AMP-forming)/AMP-acid ligase II